MLDNLCIDSWIGFLRVGITNNRSLRNLPELTGLIDLQAETENVFLLEDDVMNIDYAKKSKQYIPSKTGPRKRNKRSRERKKFAKDRNDTSMKGV
jgi:hypothetical protein